MPAHLIKIECKLITSDYKDREGHAAHADPGGAADEQSCDPSQENHGVDLVKVCYRISRAESHAR